MSQFLLFKLNLDYKDNLKKLIGKREERKVFETLNLKRINPYFSRKDLAKRSFVTGILTSQNWQ
jgi:hypothetical protein